MSSMKYGLVLCIQTSPDMLSLTAAELNLPKMNPTSNVWNIRLFRPVVMAIE